MKKIKYIFLSLLLVSSIFGIYKYAFTIRVRHDPNKILYYDPDETREFQCYSISYNSKTMSYPVSLEQAKQIARKWARNPNLKLQINHILKYGYKNKISSLYVLTSPDPKQVFEVDCNSGFVEKWIDEKKQRSYLDRRRKRVNEQFKLPITELNNIKKQFLISKYPNFTKLNIQPRDPKLPDSGFAQKLSNNVWYPRKRAYCSIDEWTGEIWKYVAFSADPPKISTKHIITSSQAERIALAYAWKTDKDTRSVFIFDKPDILIVNDKKGQERIAWIIEVFISYEAGYNMNKLNKDLSGLGIPGGVKYTIAIDANTGNEAGAEELSCPEYYPPSTKTPSFSPNEGTYDSAQSITISCPTKGATIRYTTDGTNPTPTSTLYKEPISIKKNMTLKARAFSLNHRSSVVKKAIYIIKP